MVEGVELVGADGLDDVARLVAGPRGRTAGAARRRPSTQVSGPGDARDAAVGHTASSALEPGLPPADLSDVRGQAMARWALEVALAGGHDLLLVGSPGAGKTLLARTVPGLLPPLDDREAQEVAVIRSVAGLRPDPAERRVRPFRSPHHTTSYAAMVGGGPLLQPGLVTLAHRGVLFLDELAEFDRNVLDALRQPLEDGTVEIARAHGHVRYPARLQLIAAMNPCRCGWYGEPDARCRCRPAEALAYQRRVSGPLLDRIDLRVVMSRVPPEVLIGGPHPEASSVVAARIATGAHRRAGARRRRQRSSDRWPRGRGVPPGAGRWTAAHGAVEQRRHDRAGHPPCAACRTHRRGSGRTGSGGTGGGGRGHLAARGRRQPDRRMTDGSGTDERTAWIALAAVDGLGEQLVPRLAAAFGGAATLLDVARRMDVARFGRQLRRAAETGLRPATIEQVWHAARDPVAVLRRLTELDGWVLTPWDPGYPPALRVIDPPPPALFGVGDPAALRREPLIAIVGTRRPTPLGRAFTGRVAAALATRGATVVSGLAIGIDGAAHAATLEAGGTTVAVIGGGITRGVPRSHATLAGAIRAGGGAVVGEHPPDTQPTQGTFPRRNRIISGLSRATLVIEAPLGSGALITARHALEQGRAVFAAPGRPTDPATSGCLALLRETPARPLVTIDALLVDLDLDGSQPIGRSGTPSGRPMDAADALSVLGPVERAIAELLLAGPVSSDALVRGTGQTPAVVAGALTLLQLRGWVVPMGPLQVAAGPLLVRVPGPPAATRQDPP